MSDDKDSNASSENGDMSHVSEATRIRMQRVRDLEQQRLQRVLQRSLSERQQSAQAQPPPAAENVPQASAHAHRSPNLSSRSSSLGRAGRSESVDAASTSAVIGDKKFYNRLRELADSAESEETRSRYLRLMEMEEQRLKTRPGNGESRSSRLGRSSSLHDRTSGLIVRRNSDQVNRRASPSTVRRNVYEPSASADVASVEPKPITHASSLTDLIDASASAFERMVKSRREEGMRKIEELEKMRLEGRPSLSSSSEDVRDMFSRDRLFDTSGYRGAIFQPNPTPLETRTSFPVSRRAQNVQAQYSSIQEITEPSDHLLRHSSESNLDQISMLSFSSHNYSIENRPVEVADEGPSVSMDSVPTYLNGAIQGTTFVDEDGHTQWLSPSSPKYGLFALENHSPMQKSHAKSKEIAERKKRSLLIKDGLPDHVLAECFDSEYTFEERIAAIREKLYGSKVLIPSDKQCRRGSPDGACNMDAGGSSDAGANDSHR